MKDTKTKRRRLRLILARAHRQKQEGPPQPGDDWRRGVMSRLAAHPAPVPFFDPSAVVERLVWRFVPAAAAAALILAIMVGRGVTDPAADMARIMSVDTAVSGLYTFYQSESPNE